HFLPEHHGRRRDPDDLTIEDLIAHAKEVSFVVWSVDHRGQPLPGLEDALQLEFVDEEAGDADGTLSRLELRRRTDQRPERVAAALGIIAVGVGRGRLLEDLLEGLLHLRGGGGGGRIDSRAGAGGGRRRRLARRGLRDDARHGGEHDQQRVSEIPELHHRSPHPRSPRPAWPWLPSASLPRSSARRRRTSWPRSRPRWSCSPGWRAPPP